MSSSQWLLIHGGSTLWNIEGYCSSVKGALENLTLRIKPSTQNGTCFFLSYFIGQKQVMQPHLTSNGQRSTTPMCSGGELCVMWRTVTALGKGQDRGGLSKW